MLLTVFLPSPPHSPAVKSLLHVQYLVKYIKYLREVRREEDFTTSYCHCRFPGRTSLVGRRGKGEKGEQTQEGDLWSGAQRPLCPVAVLHGPAATPQRRRCMHSLGRWARQPEPGGPRSPGTGTVLLGSSSAGANGLLPSHAWHRPGRAEEEEEPRLSSPAAWRGPELETRRSQEIRLCFLFQNKTKSKADAIDVFLKWTLNHVYMCLHPAADRGFRSHHLEHVYTRQQSVASDHIGTSASKTETGINSFTV